VRASDLETPPRGFSVNLQPDAGRLERVDPDTLAAWIDDTGARLAGDEQMLEREVSEARVGVDLFAYLLVVLVVIAALEGLLAAGFYPEAQVDGSRLPSTVLAGMRGQGRAAPNAAQPSDQANPTLQTAARSER
jgi:hypothetical protein